MARKTNEPRLDATPPPPEQRGFDARRLRDRSRDDLVREEPLRLDIDGTRLVTMRTPGQDEDFVTGFLLSEGMVRSTKEISTIEFRPGRPPSEPRPGDAPGLEADRCHVRLASGSDAEPRARSLSRVHEIRPSCGLCGIEDLDELMAGKHLEPREPHFDLVRLAGILEEFRRRQTVFEHTGACHGAAIVDASTGAFVGFGEDVGRHNALDKAIGMASRASTDFGRCLGLLSGRAGYELVAKLLRVRVPILVSVSAPTALSFDLCREAGATLIGFARGAHQKVYWDEGRLDARP
ncbi:MAG: formate dehydrogenase accessory sulfurtransferase FdhD [Planctomycetes bacterium]|nr:formate dehydrogenase accessory sulfurtransferase FdhD [Planctomycetota bacterium]